MKVATAPISWGACEIPKWGEQLPYERILDEMAEAGYAGTELGPPDLLPRDPALLERELRSRGLALVGSFCPVALHDPARHPEGFRAAHETAELLAAMGAGTLVLAAEGDDRRARVAGRVPDDGAP